MRSFQRDWNLTCSRPLVKMSTLFWSLSTLNIFLGKTTNPYQDEVRCQHPDFDDLHAIGAIVAYGAFQIISSSGKVQADAISHGRALIAWAEEMVVDIENSTATNEVEFFGDMIASLVRSLKVESANAAVCGSVSKNFPALKTRIFESAGMSCR